jgi:hypothetical protein
MFFEKRNKFFLLRCVSLFLAQMRSADRIDLRLVLEAKRKASTRDEYFAF